MILKPIMTKSRVNVLKNIRLLEEAHSLSLPDSFKKRLVNYVSFNELNTYINILTEIIALEKESGKEFFKLGRVVNKEIAQFMDEYKKIVEEDIQ